MEEKRTGKKFKTTIKSSNPWHVKNRPGNQTDAHFLFLNTAEPRSMIAPSLLHRWKESYAHLLGKVLSGRHFINNNLNFQIGGTPPTNHWQDLRVQNQKFKGENKDKRMCSTQCLPRKNGLLLSPVWKARSDLEEKKIFCSNPSPKCN